MPILYGKLDLGDELFGVSAGGVRGLARGHGIGVLIPPLKLDTAILQLIYMQDPSVGLGERAFLRLDDCGPVVEANVQVGAIGRRAVVPRRTAASGVHFER